MTQLTGGEAIVQSLLAHGVDTLFGLPGVQNDWLYNALYDAGNRIRVIHTRHEQGAAYMALGYALASGKVGVFNIVPGPGFLNAAAALVTAYGLNAPLLCLVGQIPTAKIGKGEGQLHEINDQLAIMRTMTKWAEQVTSPAQAPEMVAEAFYQLHSGRPRPVGLEVPMDVLMRRAEVDTEVEPRAPYRPPLDVAQLDRTAKVLAGAKRPLIYVGGGAVNVSREITQLAEHLQAPVVGYRTGKGIVDGRSHLSIQLTPSHELWKTTDAVLFVGSHGRVQFGGWGVDDQMTLIKIDVDPTTHNLFHKPDISITARAEEAIPYLLRQVQTLTPAKPSRRDELLLLQADWEERTTFLEPQKSYLRLIRDALGEDGIFVDELTQVGFASRILYPAYKPRTYITTGYMGTLGYGFPTALGVKVAQPDKRVVAIAGDGGFMFSVQELATAVQHRIGLVTIIFNNNQYGNVQQMQKHNYGGRVIATDLHNPDFVELARVFGANGYRAETLGELTAALEKGFASDLPTLIEVPIGDVPSVDVFRKLPKVRGN